MVQLSRDAGGRVGCPASLSLSLSPSLFFFKITMITAIHDSTCVCNRSDLPSRFTQYQRMLSNLAQCEFSMGKTLMVYDMNLREMENYETIYNNIGRTLLYGYCVVVCKYPLLLQWVCLLAVQTTTLIMKNVYSVLVK